MDDDVDLVLRVQRDFGERAGKVLNILRTCRSGGSDYLGDRVARCVVFAAAGDESRLMALLELWRQDFRDVIMAAEYDRLGILHLRDLNLPFEKADFA